VFEVPVSISGWINMIKPQKYLLVAAVVAGDDLQSGT